MAKKKFIKYAFYFRTRDEFEGVTKLVTEINNALGKSPTYGWNSDETNPAVINSPAWNMDAIRKSMPKSKPGKKKYIATVGLRPQEQARLTFDIGEALEDLGLELVSKQPNKPKHTKEDLTFGNITFRTVEHFRKVTSMLNDKYGHGNWHYRGSRKIIAKLRHVERFQNGNFIFGMPSKKERETLAKGVKVTVAVVGKVETLQPLLFKAQLMG